MLLRSVNLEMKKLLPAVALAVIVVLAIGGSLLLRHQSNQRDTRERNLLNQFAVSFSNEISGDIELNKKKILIHQAIDRLGPEKVSKLITNKFRTQSALQGHSIAHLMGASLYIKLGIGGLNYCNSSFGFGCFHGFFSTAIPHEGLSVLKKSDEKCVNKQLHKSSECQHGIGHGLNEYFGPEKLNSSLTECEKLRFYGRLIGCHDGVFMDYNFPMISHEHGDVNIQLRDFNEKNPYSPCTDLVADEKYLPDCYYELAIYAVKLFGNNYFKATEYCKGIANNEYRKLCQRGVGGEIAIINNYNKESSLIECDKMQKTDKTLCYTGVAGLLHTTPAGYPIYKDICSLLTESEKNYCLANSDILRY